MSKVAIVTGGASGIGAAMSLELAANGVEIVIADRQASLGESVAQAIRERGGKANVAEVDVRELASVKRVVDDTMKRSGRIDYLFNNAGIAVGGEVESYSIEDWTDVFDVNLKGVVNGIQAVYPLMIEQKSGHIVNTASMAGLVSTVGEASYGATKHAVVSLSKTMRIEGARHGVKVSVLCPGAIKTPILTGGKYGRTSHIKVSEEKMLEIWAQARPMPPERFAKKAIAAVFRNDAIIVVPGWWKAFWYLERISPELSMMVWGAMLKRMRKQLEEGRVESA